MDGGTISAGFFLMLIFETLFLILSSYLFLAYLYLTRGYLAFQQQSLGGGDNDIPPQIFENLPSVKTIKYLLLFYYVSQFSLAIHSHFYFKEISLLFSFHVILSSIINSSLFIMSRLDDNSQNQPEVENIVN